VTLQKRKQRKVGLALGTSSQTLQLSPRERQIAFLLLEGCENSAIASGLGMKLRTVKAHMNRMFMRLGITDGYKRVKLAKVLYQDQSWIGMESENSATLSDESLDWLPTA
jgi:DNA-binding NarL/FixJ family response regulator